MLTLNTIQHQPEVMPTSMQPGRVEISATPAVPAEVQSTVIDEAGFKAITITLNGLSWKKSSPGSYTYDISTEKVSSLTSGAAGVAGDQRTGAFFWERRSVIAAVNRIEKDKSDYFSKAAPLLGTTANEMQRLYIVQEVASKVALVGMPKVDSKDNELIGDLAMINANRRIGALISIGNGMLSKTKAYSAIKSCVQNSVVASLKRFGVTKNSEEVSAALITNLKAVIDSGGNIEKGIAKAAVALGVPWNKIGQFTGDLYSTLQKTMQDKVNRAIEKAGY